MIPILQMVDSLAIGGTENMAVSLANNLPRETFEAHLCTTRTGGPLQAKIAPHVRYLALTRRGRFDLSAIFTLARYLRHHNIHLIHAHGTSAFIATAAALFAPGCRVIWHIHHGHHALAAHVPRSFRLLAHGVDGVITVNHQLEAWAKTALKIKPNRVWYLSNFVDIPTETPPTTRTGRSILCIANLRDEKDPLTLVRAMRRVADRVPDAHLRIAGGAKDPAYLKMVENEIARLGLTDHITLLGQQNNIQPLLYSSDIGVLSSKSEGLPVTVLEYGAARLPVVATRTGQIPQVLDEGRCGILVPTESPDALADGLIALLESPEQRHDLGAKFYQRIVEVYSAPATMHQLEAMYRAVGI